MNDKFTIRMRRLRTSESMRRLVRGVSISVDNLVYPLFVCPGGGVKKPIGTMADCFHFSPDKIVDEAKEIFELGIRAVLLFGLAENKDETGSQAYEDSGAVQQAIRNIKKAVPDMLVITDVCLCAYTTCGHCGIIKNGEIDNDITCEVLAKVAVSHAKAGADMVAPSDMMDGRVGIIRKSLDENGFGDTAIMSYSAKYASAFYGPFRDAADSAPAFGDRKTYQMDIASSSKQAMREIELDIAEGADIVMVKPALPYLDIIHQAKQRFDVPIAAYQVSGEYMMIDSAAKQGVLDRKTAVLESLYAIKRAGADIIITYFAKEIVKWI
ncbi:MAG: porphobilinogen synthase [Planctomycetes bacterium]|nr:porphobilinogen synthase [Planctomycetota bacterium]MBU1517875.1 porphobilinogen synthase [Planctomycetota bacterium]MBU2458011.1 porphobilinogen synthase [Planctomycetota bacterium]